MELQPESLIEEMLDEVADSLRTLKSESLDPVRTSFQEVAQCLAGIEAMKLAGSISNQQAELLLDQQKARCHTLLQLIEGIGKATAASLLAKALWKIKDIVNKAVGFELIK